VRDIADVRDVADAIVCAARAPQVPAVVNIGSGTGVALKEAVDELIRIAGSRAAVVSGTPPARRRDEGVGDQPLDISLASRALGWTPTRSLGDALRGMWESIPRRHAPETST
jgi:nucleoside-diphosphate-sugar epimerase